MYRDGKVIDIILERKILDKRINVKDLVSGDRDAIILWLRATAYGNEYPIIARNPDNGNKYNVSIDLRDFKYYDFNLKGDEDGCFEYKTGNEDIIKYRYFTNDDEKAINNIVFDKTNNAITLQIVNNLRKIREDVEKISRINDSDREDINGCLDDITNIMNGVVEEFDEKEAFVEVITEQMIMHTYSVNGNTDREFIRKYIMNMRAGEALRYRVKINENKVGVDFTININIPESEGGGSFATFLRLDDSVFLNIREFDVRIKR